MKKSDLVYFIDKHVIPMISSEYKIGEEAAMRNFIDSQTHRMLLDYSLELFMVSPMFIFDMYKKEIETGNPKNSSYIQGDAYV